MVYGVYGDVLACLRGYSRLEVVSGIGGIWTVKGIAVYLKYTFKSVAPYYNIPILQ